MIEVEKKLALALEHLEEIQSKGQLLEEVTYSDTYYDMSDFCLTTGNVWLRERNGRFQLKIKGRIGSSEEVQDDNEILRQLGLESEQPILATLEQAEITPFCKLTTQRRKFLLDEIPIHIDQVDFGDQTYSVAEINITVEKKKDATSITKKINQLLKRWNIDADTNAPSKISVYLHRKNPSHFEALLKAGVAQPILEEALSTK